MTTTTRQWLLNGHPRGRGIAEDDFKLVDTELPSPGEGEMLLKTHYLGFDPAQKGWMENIADYVAPMNIGDVMRGSGICEVVESNGGKFAAGDMVFGTTGWTEHLVHNGEGLTKVETSLSPTAVLSVLGTTGLTAYCGLFKVGKPVAGDTVLVSGAAGATGSVVGQLAKIAGCRAVGIAGGPKKCEWLVKEAGYDAAIDYKAGGVKEQIKEHCPRGVDVIYDNVGGSILNDMLANIATNARVVICGGISRYETGQLPAGPENYFNLVFRRGTMAGFIVLDWAGEFPGIRKRLEGFVNDGSLKYQEDIQQGFENAPDTLQRLFSGKNRGKQLLKL
ncbi:NADP-dependent oxidoreductase [Erythrobacter sp. YT30]|uniref:NADP-dependent oxidoreductase n=1 Tax=Erythrobacter sp. YT30 TaxID=1735012 RepID=UPI00076D1356|nr:NADP-dependent oxidoreductase [Erythrobacter sp. YT30]KWV91310.1 NADP-dependent oxidoreductase [Erythrobacter sp. YT30]